MPLDVPETDRSTLLTDGFGELGRVEATMAPRSKRASDRVAYEYWAASLLSRLAEARRERAKKAAIAGGVLPDYAADPMAVGTSAVVYASDVVTISVKVVEQADRVNVAALVADLEKTGIALRTLRRLVKKHTTPYAGAHIFTASLVK